MHSSLQTEGPISPLCFTANSAKHPYWGSLLGIPIRDFFKRVLVLIQNPTQQSNGLSPTPSYQRTLISAQRHCHLIKQTTEVPRKWCRTPELQFVTISARVSAISYYFHRSLVCESGIWAVNTITKQAEAALIKYFSYSFKHSTHQIHKTSCIWTSSCVDRPTLENKSIFFMSHEWKSTLDDNLLWTHL